MATAETAQRSSPLGATPVSPADASASPLVVASTSGPLATASAPELQMVADLKAELFHVSRQLTQARQQARAGEETCGELRQRLQGVEMEKQTLTLELQEVQERLQARQSRLDEHRRDAADAKLRVVSLSAERDELAVKVQEAWDHIAELNTALRTRGEELLQLQEDVRSARHAEAVVVEQRSAVERELRLLQTTVQEGSADRRADAITRERLTTALQTAVQRVADVLSRAACEYQESIVEGGEWAPSRLTGAVAVAAAAQSGVGREKISMNSGGDPPHVVLSPAFRPPSAAPTHTPRSASVESVRLQAESLLHNADAVVWQEPQRACETPERHGALTGQGHLATMSQEPAVQAAIAPLLLALKQVAAMLSTVRHAQSRLTAEANHYCQRYEEAQQQLEAVQRAAQVHDAEASAVRQRTRQLQQQAEAAEQALRQCRQEDEQRRASLAAVLRCREEWALIQHAVERLLVRHGELQKDLVQWQRASSRREGESEAAEEKEQQLSSTHQHEEPIKAASVAPQALALSTRSAPAPPAGFKASERVPPLPVSLVSTPHTQRLAAARYDGTVDTDDAREAAARSPAPPAAAAHDDSLQRAAPSLSLQAQSALATPPASQPPSDTHCAVSRVYPAPLPAAPMFAAPSTNPASATERALLHSLYGSAQRTSLSSPPPLPAAPPAASSGLDQSSMFAVEVLQVIEALDRRVSGALHRAQRS